MAQQGASKLTGDQKHIESLVNQLRSKYSGEFAITTYDGLLLAVPKDAYCNVTPIDSLQYEITSFGSDQAIGTGRLQFMTPGSVIPMFPTTVDVAEDGTELKPGMRFMDKVVILSGANHVDKTAEVISGVHNYDQLITAMNGELRKRKYEVGFHSLPNSVGVDLLDAASNDSLNRNYAKELFQNHFPEIPEDQRSEYVLFVTCHAKAAIDYVLGNLEVFQQTIKKGQGFRNKCGLRVSPKTMAVKIDNDRLNSVTAYCRLLSCNDNKVMLNPQDVDRCYGGKMCIKDPVLQEFNRSLKEGMVFEAESCSKLPPSRFLASILASTVMYDHPTPMQMPFESDDTGLDLLVDRLNAISSLFIRNRVLLSMPSFSPPDQLACMTLGVLKNSGISPEALKYYRSDTPIIEEGELPNSPWPMPLAEYTRQNMKKVIGAMNTDVDEKTKLAARLEETMRGATYQLLTLLNYRDHIFHVDLFKNLMELYEDFIKLYPDRSTTKPGSDLNQMRIKPLCGWNVFRADFGIVQNIYSKFHYDPIAFKRNFIVNALYYLGGQENVRLQDDIERSPLPDFIEVVNTAGIAKEKGARYACQHCGDVPFYQREGPHCLCFLFLKVAGTLAGERSSTLKDVRVLYEKFVKNVGNNFDFNGSMTSCKTLHNVMVNEAKSSAGHFGKISLQHGGRANGFGVKKRNKKPDRKGNDNVVGATDRTTTTATLNEHKEQPENCITGEKDSKTLFLETRKMESITKDVKMKLKGNATLTDPRESNEEDFKSSYFWNIQRFWLGSDPDGNAAEAQDLKIRVTGTEDNATERCKQVLLTDVTAILPLLKNDKVPAPIKPPDQPNINKHAMSRPMPNIVSRKRKRDTFEQQTDDEEEDEDEDEDDYDDANKENICPTGKKSNEKQSQKDMTNFVKALLYKVLTDGGLPAGTTTDDFNSRHAKLLEKWKADPQRKNAQFRSALRAFLFGNRCSYENFIDPADPHSLFARIVESYLKRIPAFISDIHTALASTLDMTPEELEEEHPSIYHYEEKAKRELVSWIDFFGSDSVNKRSSMLTMYEVVRHEVEARACKTASETQVNKENSHNILKNKNGPFCLYVEGNFKVRVPTVQDDPSLRMPVLKMSTKSTHDAQAAFNMPLPVKMKVNLNLSEIDEKFKAKPNYQPCVTNPSEYETDMDCFEAEDVFIPKPLLNSHSALTPTMIDAPRPAHELAAILRDRSLKFTKIGTSKFMDITKRREIVSIMNRYLLSRKGFTKIPKLHNLVMQEFINMINLTLSKMLIIMQTVTGVMSKVVPIPHDYLTGLFCTMSEKLASTAVLAKAFEAVCCKNICLAGGLYLLALCTELYAPPSLPKDGDKNLERDNHAVNSICAGILRLYVGPDDCNTETRKPESKQVRMMPVLSTYLNGRKTSVVTTTDKSRVSATQMMMLIQMNSYTSTYGNSNVFTAARGGAPVTKGIAPFMQHVVKQQFVEGDHIHLVCHPLVIIPNTVLSKSKETIASVVESYTLQPFIAHFIDNQQRLLPGLITLYSDCLPKPIDQCTEEEVLEACLNVHRAKPTDTSTDLYKTVIFQKIYAIMNGSDSIPAYNDFEDYEDENVWSDSDD